MDKRFTIENFQWDRHHNQMNELYFQVSSKYPNGMYWSYDPNFCSWENTVVLLDQMYLNEGGIGKVIGKAQVKYYHKLEDTVPNEVMQRIIFHYRVMPEYENVSEAVELLFHAIVEKSICLAAEVPSVRKSVLCQSCTDNEEFYIKHIQEKGYIERTGYYCMSIKKGEENLGELQPIDGIDVRNITKEFESYKGRILQIEEECFLDDLMSSEEFDDVAKECRLTVYGAFDKEQLIGLCIGDQPEGDLPEVFSLNVCEEYRRKGIGKYLLITLLKDLKEIGADFITLAVKNDNEPAISLYRAIGFVEYRNERMFGKEHHHQSLLS